MSEMAVPPVAGSISGTAEGGPIVAKIQPPPGLVANGTPPIVDVSHRVPEASEAKYWFVAGLHRTVS
jgi:hypothetical protein